MKRIPGALAPLLVPGVLALIASIHIAACALTLEDAPHPGVPVSGDVEQAGAATVQFDRRAKIPRWTLEKLTAESLAGDAHRRNRFYPPADVPREFRPELEDYAGSGFDRGHNVPSGDVVGSQEANDETFSLANMSPQYPALNRGLWARLEAWCREQTAGGATVYVVTTGLFAPTVWTDASGATRHDLLPQGVAVSRAFLWPMRAIGGNHVLVPTHLAKSVLIVKSDGSYAMASFAVPNDKPPDHAELADYRVTTDLLEHWSGLDLWPRLPDDLEERLEAAK